MGCLMKNELKEFADKFYGDQKDLDSNIVEIVDKNFERLLL